MMIIAEIDGWQKVMEVPNHCLRSRVVDISKDLPPTVTPNPHPPTNKNVTIFRLFHNGYICRGLPLFKWEWENL